MNIVLVIGSVIPVTAYGGTQRVIWYLGKELVKLGHCVTFLAGRGSTCDFARVIPIEPARNIIEQIPEEADIVHFNNAAPAGVRKPYIVTYHGNFIPGNLERNAVFVSRNHAARYGSTSFVYNGLDWDDYGPVDFRTPRKDFHFLGKAAWSVKNVKGAIDVVKALPGEHIHILGGYRFNLKMGMRFTFTPKARFHGMVGGEEKLRFLKNSKGLIFPVKWDEPFGLAITESLYCGAPVFGTPYGSLPELVTPEVGFLSADSAEMTEHLLHGYHYTPQTCHEYAADLFNSQVMAKAYLQKYEQTANGHPLNEHLPHALKPDGKQPWR